MHVKRPTAATGLRLFGNSLLVAGPVLVSLGLRARSLVRSELVQQRIAFPDREQLPGNLECFAGRSVNSGVRAKAYAELIKLHLNRATAGRTYSELARESHEAGDADEKLLELRDTAWRGETLRAGLLGAYQATQLTALVTGLGALITALGASLLGISGALHSHGTDRRD
jgi:hypothetical protein